MYLSELIESLKDINALNLKDFRVMGIADNSKEVKTDYIFAAIKGNKFDGHNFISEAIKKGAKCIVSQQKTVNNDDVTLIKTQNSRKTLAELAVKFYNNMDINMNIVGITGTTGKTTTSYMINKVIEDMGYKTGIIGTLQVKSHKETFKPNYTTPDAITLNKLISKMKQKGVKHLSMEVSSHGISQYRAYGIPFTIGVFTNISKEHLRYHKSFQNYFNTKKQFFKTHLPNSGFAVINIDDKHGPSILKDINCNAVTYGFSSNADIQAETVKTSSRGTLFKLKINKTIKSLMGKISPMELTIKLKIPGLHNVYNALACIASCAVLDIPLPHIKHSLESFKGAKRRMEIIYNKEIQILDDFAHNPGSINAVMKSLKNFEYNNLVLVNFLKGSRGVEENRENAEIISKYASFIRLKKVVTTRSQDQVTEKNRVLPEEEYAYTMVLRKNGIPIVNTVTLKNAIETGLNSLNPGDAMLLMGTIGMDAGAKIALNLLKNTNIAVNSKAL